VAYGINNQGEVVFIEDGASMPQGVHATWTPSMGGTYTPSHTDYQSRYQNNMRAGGAIEQMLGVKPGQYATVGGEIKNKGFWERYSESPTMLALTAFGAGIGIPALLAAAGAGGGGAAGGALLANTAAPGSSIYGGLAAAGYPGAAAAGGFAGGAGAAGALLPNTAGAGSAINSGLATAGYPGSTTAGAWSPSAAQGGLLKNARTAYDMYGKAKSAYPGSAKKEDDQSKLGAAAPWLAGAGGAMAGYALANRGGGKGSQYGSAMDALIGKQTQQMEQESPLRRLLLSQSAGLLPTYMKQDPQFAQWMRNSGG
jgi:hypothetical protein